jgi:hypothetical protein
MRPPIRPDTRPAHAKARRMFWVLVAITVLAMGLLTSTLARPASVWTGLTVAASGVVLLLASALACRVMLALEQRRRPEAVGGELSCRSSRARGGHRGADRP